jgi:hypothetical protein
LSDRVIHRALLGAGVLVLLLADLLLAADAGVAGLLLGIALWGVHLALLAAMVADTAPAELRGTAYGVFNLLSGLAMLLASSWPGCCGNTRDPPAPSSPARCSAACRCCCSRRRARRARVRTHRPETRTASPCCEAHALLRIAAIEECGAHTEKLAVLAFRPCNASKPSP